MTVRTAVTFARDRNLEREAVIEERAVLRDALQRSLGEARIEDVKAEVERRVQAEEFITAQQASATPGRAFTTAAMIELERETIHMMRSGQERYRELVAEETRRGIAEDYRHLSDSQRTAVEQLLTSRDRVTALEGTAGTGKTTTLAAIRDAAEREGYEVQGLAPTSRAAHKLYDAGIEASTLQRHLAQSDDEPRSESRRLFVLDESSLASTKQMHTFLQRLGTEDRVLLVGDVRQHEAVDAGRPYQQLQEAGIATARLDEIVRQQNPGLKGVVEHLSRGEVDRAVEALDRQSLIHEIPRREDRLQAIAQEYVRDPNGTLVVSPDNRSRRDINEVIHRSMQREGHVDREEHRVRVLVPRQEITGTDRQWAERYEPGDMVRYSKGSKALGLNAGNYARIEAVDAKENRVTVSADDGRGVTYDPRRLQGVTVYREAERAFAHGDRVQFTAPDRSRDVANRDLGTIEHIDPNGRLQVRLDSGRSVTFEPQERRHLDYGYAVTSHSSQGQTTDRVLVHVETDRASEKLVNRRLAYVAVSRGRYDAQLYTDDKEKLRRVLDRDVSHSSALARDGGQSKAAHSAARDGGPAVSAAQTVAVAHS
ncbi:MAG: AAA family ATPase [Acidobacteria bacterium]|nr:AAA family ATPase [Acidobacteriota bacterium]